MRSSSAVQEASTQISHVRKELLDVEDTAAITAAPNTKDISEDTALLRVEQLPSIILL
jgi:hypothetical protein